MNKILILNQKPQVGDIVAYQTRVPTSRGRSKKVWLLGTFEEIWNDTLQRFVLRFDGIDKEKTKTYNVDFIKPVKIQKT